MRRPPSVERRERGHLLGRCPGADPFVGREPVQRGDLALEAAVILRAAARRWLSRRTPRVRAPGSTARRSSPRRRTARWAGRRSGAPSLRRRRHARSRRLDAGGQRAPEGDRAHDLDAARDDEIVRCPHMTSLAAKWAACCDEPHCRSIVTPGTSRADRPTATGARDVERLRPDRSTQPKITSSTVAGSMPERSTSAVRTCAPRSAGCTCERAPPRLPTGDRTASTMYASPGIWCQAAYRHDGTDTISRHEPEGAVALVTGGASGLGRATAETLQARGATSSCSICSGRSKRSGDDTGAEAGTRRCSDPDGVAAVVALARASARCASS